MIRIAIAVAIAGLRIAGVTHESYQAAAHLFVGGLLGAWIVEEWKPGTVAWHYDGPGCPTRRSLNLWLAIGLSVVEVACFLWFRFVQV